MRKNILAAVFFAAIVILFIFVQPESDKQAGVGSEVLVENLDTPWAIDFLPGGEMIFTERGGRVSIFDNGELKAVGNIKVSEVGEGGLLGIAVDPEFAKNRFVYLYYTHESGNRVSRFVLNEKLENEFVLLGSIPSASIHNGGRIKFGPDGKLYIATGDSATPSLAQDIDSLAGKILRMNKDGKIPEDNPFGNYVYSYGHRNPQGIAWHAKELYASEHGPSRNDELNIILKGANYGWPAIECDESSEKYVNPIRCYSEFTLAPSGIAFYKNELYIAGLGGNQLRRIIFDKDYKTILREEELLSELGRIREVVEHNGYLYVSTSNRDGRGMPRVNDDKIIRIKIE